MIEEEAYKNAIWKSASNKYPAMKKRIDNVAEDPKVITLPSLSKKKK
jgi:hypothetical protein